MIVIFLDHANDAASVEDAQKAIAHCIAAFDNPAAGLESTDPFTRLVSRFGHTVQSSVTPHSLRTLAAMLYERPRSSARSIDWIISKKMLPSQEQLCKRRLKDRQQ